MLETKYDHLKVEENKYNTWLEKDYFKPKENDCKPFSIVIPPPNVTGVLHLGHALDTTLQDIIIRYKRMQGFDTLWLPGMDHAAIATEAKVVDKLKKEGIDKYEFGRENFLNACWDWTHEHADTIRKQWAKLGLSLDYSRERFTLDEGLNKAVTKVFVDYYNKDLIYRGERIINWDPVAMTALSNEEVIYQDDPGAFYHLKYIISGTNDYLDVATTRPETLFGDTAVAVNPNDERYKNLIGKTVILPVVNKEIPIIGDIHADPEFGTGVVKITPAHDPNDFEVGERHNLERIVVMNPDATMNQNAGKYEGQTREECRENLLNDLKEMGLLLSIEPMVHSVGHSERTGAMVEPYLSKQWFVKMDTLSNRVLEFQKDKDKKVNFVPARFEKHLNHWMEIQHDWCISRQLWWGHRIPAWYKGDEVYVGMEAPEGEGWVQDNDVLDTWFSSALWPFSTLGWPENTEDMKRYFPNSCLVTGFDIIFFWVARMVFQSEELTGERPFKDCLIHGLIRDKQGRKMSKSLGNGVDPMDMIDKYGADALRHYLTTDVAAGTDLNFDEDKIKSTWNYINKIWNASRFVLMNIEGITDLNFTDLTSEDKWILTRYNETIKEVTKAMDKYDFNIVGSTLYNFIYDDFCSNYIEMAKFNMDNANTKKVLCYVLTGILKMLHPFMPFVTEEIYSMLPVKDSESIVISNYPTYNKDEIYLDDATNVAEKIKFISLFRSVKNDNNIPKDAKVIINTNDEMILNMLKIKEYLITEELNINFYNVNTVNYSAKIFYEKQVSEDELNAIKKQIESLEASIKRREGLLANENYCNKAPKELVEKERVTLEEERKLLNNLKEGK